MAVNQLTAEINAVKDTQIPEAHHSVVLGFAETCEEFVAVAGSETITQKELALRAYKVLDDWHAHETILAQYFPTDEDSALQTILDRIPDICQRPEVEVADSSGTESASHESRADTISTDGRTIPGSDGNTSMTMSAALTMLRDVLRRR